MSDLISKEKLKDDIAVLLERNDKLIDEWLADCIDDVIDEQPTVDAEPVKHGRWIEDSEGWWHCSVCGRGIPPKLKQDLNEFNKWCGRCGAIMDEVEE